MYLERAKALWYSSSITSGQTVFPCTDKEINELENQLGYELPGIYREYLRWMGRGTDEFFRDSYTTYRYLLEMQTEAIEILKNFNFPGELPDDAFVFYNHESCIFCFLRISMGNNSPVFRYDEADDTSDFFQYSDNFEDFLVNQINEYIEAYKKLKEYIEIRKRNDLERNSKKRDPAGK